MHSRHPGASVTVENFFIKFNVALSKVGLHCLIKNEVTYDCRFCDAFNSPEFSRLFKSLFYLKIHKFSFHFRR